MFQDVQRNYSKVYIFLQSKLSFTIRAALECFCLPVAKYCENNWLVPVKTGNIHFSSFPFCFLLIMVLRVNNHESGAVTRFESRVTLKRVSTPLSSLYWRWKVLSTKKNSSLGKWTLVSWFRTTKSLHDMIRAYSPNVDKEWEEGFVSLSKGPFRL